MDFPLTGFRQYLLERGKDAGTAQAYTSFVRGALRAVSPLTEEGLRQYALDVAHKSWAATFRTAWHAFENYSQAAKTPVPALPRGGWASRAARDAPAWAWALRELVTSCRLSISAVPGLTWDDVTFGIEHGAIRWREIRYPVPMPVLRALREAAGGGHVPKPHSPLVPILPGSPQPMSQYRMSQIVTIAQRPASASS